MTREEALEIIKNFDDYYLDIPSDLVTSLEDKDILNSECFGDDLDLAMCVHIVKIDGNVYYLADGYEWDNITTDIEEVMGWYDNYNENNPDEEERERERGRLKEWLRMYEKKMKLCIFKLENKPEIFVDYSKDNFFEGFYDPYTKIIDKEAKEKLKKLKIDIDELYKKEMSLEAVLENLDDETKEEVEYVLNDLSYLPQAYPSCYCEDIHNKKDIERLEDNLYFIDNDGFITTKDDILSWDYDTYYHWWDGSNHKCVYVEWLDELEVKKTNEDEIQKFEEQCYYENSNYMKTYHYNYYKTPDEKLFRVFVSYYQGSLDSIDEEFGDWKEIEKELI